MDDGAWNDSTGSIVTAVPSFFVSTPKASSMRSVWSREVKGSTTVVGLSAYMPESRMADLTCALATGLS